MSWFKKPPPGSKNVPEEQRISEQRLTAQLGITLHKVRKSFKDTDQSKIDYNIRRALCKMKLKEDAEWQLALAGKLLEDADRGGKETSTSSSTIDDSASRSAKKARTGELSPHTAIDGLQVGDRVIITVQGCEHVAEGYPAGLWPAKVIDKLKGDRVKIEWMQSVPGSKDWDTERASHELQKDLIYKLRQDIELLAQQLDVSRGEQRPLQALAEDVRRKFRLLANEFVLQLAKAKIEPKDQQDLMNKLFQCADKHLEDKLQQFHAGIGSMIGTNTNDGGSKSKEVEHLLLRWLGENSIFTKPSNAFREAAAEALKAPAFQKDKDLAARVSELSFKLTPLLAQMRVFQWKPAWISSEEGVYIVFPGLVERRPDGSEKVFENAIVESATD